MKQLIDKLSLGIIEYEAPFIECSISSVELTMETGNIHRDSFHIESVNGLDLTGKVYATDKRVIIDNFSFNGTGIDIEYFIDTKSMTESGEITGNINIISNGGEIIIPFDVKVEHSSISVSTGNIKNLFHFANLVQMNYDEALKIFYSEEFYNILQEENKSLISIYQGLKSGYDRKYEMEEFLIASNKKKRIDIKIEKQEVQYEDLTENYGDSVVISKDTWGYANIHVENQSEFIKIGKKQIETGDFSGNHYEFPYIIEYDNLHYGVNYGKIIFRYNNHDMEYIIKVINGGTAEKDIKKESICYLYKNYIDFRMKKIDVNRWSEDSLKIIGKIRGYSDEDLFIKLFNAQIAIATGRENDGQFILDNVAEELIAKREEKTELYCYYLYIRTLQKRDEEFTSEVLKTINNYYENGNDSWKILWIRMYLEESYENNFSLKLTKIKEEFLKGMRSPLMYFEAMQVINSMPGLLKDIGRFEIELLLFGVKYDYIDKNVCHHLAYAVSIIKYYDHNIIKVLKFLYEKYKDNLILETICSMMIKGNKTSEDCFKYYSAAIENNIKITGIFEYYIQSLNKVPEYMPSMVLMYFVYKNDKISREKLDIIYAYIIKNKDKDENIFRLYDKQIEKYGFKSILKGRISQELAVIYKEILIKSMVTPELSEKLPGILNTYKIELKDENIRSVVIIHKETKGEKVYTPVNKIVYVKMYTEDCTVILEHYNGSRIYDNNEFTIEKLFDFEEYLKLCYEIYIENDYVADYGLVLYFVDKYIRYKKNPEKSIEILKHVSEMKNIRNNFRTEIEKLIVEYYSQNYDGDSLDEYIDIVEPDNLCMESKNKIIEIAIIRGLYSKAFELMSKYGFEKIEPRRVLKCVTQIMKDNEDKNITDMCIFAFRKGKYNDETLEYLCKYFNGITRELIDIWKACSDYQHESRELEEKLITQMLYTGSYVSNMDMIYDSYYKKGLNRKIKKAYIVKKAYDYFVKESIIDESIFKYIERELIEGSDVNDISQIAYLKYCSELSQLTKDQSELCRESIYELTKRNKIFEFYKKFNRYFKIPYTISDKTIIEYRTDPANKVYIHYHYENLNEDEKEYLIGEMTDSCYGIYTFNIILFYGENLKYYITEDTGKESKITESCEYTLTDLYNSGINTHYSKLNDMMVCEELREEKTLGKLAKDYYIEKSLVDRLFKKV